MSSDLWKHAYRSVKSDKNEKELSKYDSKTTTYPKTQEASSKDLFNCIYSDMKNEREKFEAEYLRCNNRSIKDIKQEFLDNNDYFLGNKEISKKTITSYHFILLINHF